jgi:hypothetical protein
MARTQGIRIWRFDAAGRMWQYRSKRHGNMDLAASVVELPRGTRAVSQGDFLFEDVAGLQGADRIRSIPRRRVFGVVPARLVPADSDVWFWDGTESHDGFHLIYHRRGTREERSERYREQRAQIQAVLPEDALILKQGYVVILQSETRAIVFTKETRHEEVHIEVSEGRVNMSVGQDDDFDHGQILAMLATQLHRNRQKLLSAFQSEDPETAAQAVVEFIKGATPSPTQGSNVLHSLPSVIDDIAKLREVVQCNVDQADAEGVTGGFGQGVGVVDLGWQSVGSVLTYMSDVVQAAKVSQTDKSQRKDLFGANAQKRAWASVGTSGSKSVSTIVKAFDGINQVANSTSSITQFAGTASGFGAVAAAVTMCRSFHQARKANARQRALKKMQRLQTGAADDSGKALHVRPETAELLAYATNKVTRKKRVKIYEGSVAGLSVVGGTILTVAAAVAAANAWNPVGWGIGIAAFILGTGMLVYKIYRKAKKKSIQRGDFPRLLVGRYLHLQKHHRPGGLRSARTKSRREVEIQVIEGMLLAYGVEPYRCFFPKEVPLLQARIARHLKS